MSRPKTTLVLLIVALASSMAFAFPAEGGNDDDLRMKRPGFLPARGKKNSQGSILLANSGGDSHGIVTRHVTGFLPARGRKSLADEISQATEGFDDSLEQEIHEMDSPGTEMRFRGESLPAPANFKRSVGFVGMRGRKSSNDDLAAEEYWRHRADWMRQQASPGAANWNYMPKQKSMASFYNKRGPMSSAFVITRGR